MARIGIVGGGGWGTALAHHMALQEGDIDLWVREEEVCLQIERRGVNEEFLPGVSLSPGIHPVRSLAEVSSNKEFLIIVVPSQFFRTIVTEISPLLPPSTPLLVATKGIESDTLMTMSQVVASVRGRGCDHALACLSGPSFAREVCEQHPTAVTIASSNAELAAMFQERLSTEYFRAYTTDDVIGVELGGALKNVIAIAAGTSDGLGFGFNARAALITRGLAEISRLGVAMGAEPLTFSGLAGLGDLVLTCTGDLSRNRMVGLKVAEGMTVEAIIASMRMIAEGIKTSKAAHMLAQRMGVEMPITAEVYRIIYEGKDPRKAVRDLMTRQLKGELEG
ncbi:MAG: NAD(P)-dependent glycerol-3-phosphate dehydrogenase [Deltaproteobacteria bacterium]|nr:NAD(P)-dependent glycerol-3-phosphate dehydrogenase [Deltaproteobacteria bacterium]